MDYINNVYTQHLEAFNKSIKYEIKKRKGIKTFERENFLTEITLNETIKIIYYLKYKIKY